MKTILVVLSFLAFITLGCDAPKVVNDETENAQTIVYVTLKGKISFPDGTIFESYGTPKTFVVPEKFTGIKKRNLSKISVTHNYTLATNVTVPSGTEMSFFTRNISFDDYGSYWKQAPLLGGPVTIVTGPTTITQSSFMDDSGTSFSSPNTVDSNLAAGTYMAGFGGSLSSCIMYNFGSSIDYIQVSVIVTTPPGSSTSVTIAEIVFILFQNC